jgi:hypothetical protein
MVEGERLSEQVRNGMCSLIKESNSLALFTEV